MRTVLVAALGAAAVVVTGCGSSGQPLDATFRAHVNGVCQTAINDKVGHPFPIANFDPRHPRAQQLPAVGAYFAAYGDAQLIADRLRSLGEPPKQAAAWDRLRGLIDQASANALTQQRAAEDRDVAGFERTLDTAERLQKQIDAAGKRLGFDGHTACGRYFG
jgi:hypothetical protein